MQKRTEATRGSASLLHKAIACILSVMLMMSYSSIAYAFDGEATDASTTEDTSASDTTTDDSVESEEATDTEEAEEAASTGAQTNAIQTLANTDGHFTISGGTEGTGWTFNSNVIAINADGEYTITGDGEDHSGYQITIAGDIEVTLTLNNVKITNSSAAAMSIDGTAKVVLKLEGENSFTSTGNRCAGIQFANASEGASLEITSDSDGSLTAQGDTYGAGIGGGYEQAGNYITISGGTVTATGGTYGAGIGGGSGTGGTASNITISGGTVYAYGGGEAAGIGSGWNASASNITISGGTVTATGGDYYGGGAGIGSGKCGTASNIKITGGTVIATGGSGISTRDIGGGAGIGGGYGENEGDGSASSIEISGGTVTAIGGEGAAGIGGGYYGSGSITISGGTVSATAGSGAQAIGGGVGTSETSTASVSYTNGYYWRTSSGASASFTSSATEEISLPGSYTYVEIHEVASFAGGHFIVTGDDGWSYSNNTIFITATGEYSISKFCSCDDDTEHSGYQITIAEGIEVTLTINNVKITNSSAAAMDIASTATVILNLEGENSFTSTASGYAGIQFNNATTGSLTITSDTDGSLTAQGGANAAGIGGGASAAGNNITISGGTVTAIAGSNADAIGSGTGGSTASGITVNYEDGYHWRSSSSDFVTSSDTETLNLPGGYSYLQIYPGDTEFHFALQDDNSEVHYYLSDVIAIEQTGTYTIIGDDCDDHEGYQIAITENTDITLTLNNVKITNGSAAAMDIDGTAKVILDLEGENSFASGSGYAGIQFNNASTGSLKITSESGTGSLTAIGGANAAGIGGGSGSSASYITISGGTVTATGGYGAAGIGSGYRYYGSASYIEISGGTVTAQGGYYGAGIGGGWNGQGNNITISGGTVTASGGYSAAGIGSGSGSSASNIKITGGTVEATGGDAAAGIGSGFYGSARYIEISGGTVTAQGGLYAAGIGSGNYASASYITISGGTVTATGGTDAAGIGGGYYGSGTSITITGGIVTAEGGTNADAIGSGYGGSTATNITVSYDGDYYWRSSSGGTFTSSTTSAISLPGDYTYVQIYPGDGMVESMSFNTSSESIVIGETLDLSSAEYLTVSPSTYNLDYATWSSDSDCVTVDNSGTITGVSVGSATITVSAAILIGSAVTEVTDSITITVNKITPTASDFVFVTPSDTEYDGSSKEASVSVASGINGMGDIISVEYSSDNGASWSSTAPTDAGTYLVRITVDEGTNYTAATVESDEWTFTITDSSDDRGGTGGEEGGSGEGDSGSGSEGDEGSGSEGGSSSEGEGDEGGSSGDEGDQDDNEDDSDTSESAWTRLAGDDRYATMVEVVQEAFADGSSGYVVIASGQNFADSLTASSLAGVLDAPIILVSADELSTAAEEQITRLGATQAYIVGGESSVSESVFDAVEDIVGSGNVTRVSGSDRYATAVEVAKTTVSILASRGKTFDTVILASGTGYADALSISPYAYTSASPIILVGSDGMLDDASADWIKSSDATSLIIAGGTSSVSGYAVGQTGITNSRRLAGSDRYETSIAIANWALDNGHLSAEGIVIASGQNFPDALSSSALCGQLGSVLILVPSSSRNIEVENFIAANASSITFGYTVGGTGSVSEAVEAAIKEAAGLNEQ